MELNLEKIKKWEKNKNEKKLIKAFQEGDKEIREAALKSLNKIKEDFDKDHNKLKQLIKTLGEIGDVRAIDSLKKLLDHQHKSIRKSATDSLKKIGTPRALEVIKEHKKGKQNGSKGNSKKS